MFHARMLTSTWFKVRHLLIAATSVLVVQQAACVVSSRGHRPEQPPSAASNGSVVGSTEAGDPANAGSKSGGGFRRSGLQVLTANQEPLWAASPAVFRLSFLNGAPLEANLSVHWIALLPNGQWLEPCGAPSAATECMFTPDVAGEWSLWVLAYDEAGGQRLGTEPQLFTVNEPSDDAVSGPARAISTRVTSVQVSTNANPRANELVTISASSAGSPQPRYRYFSIDPVGTRRDLCNGYSSASSCAFRPTTTGTWQVIVHARDAQSRARYDALARREVTILGACPPEPVYPDTRGEPRNTAGYIRHCWPGEAYCYCDQDNDCYAQSEYVACGGTSNPSFSFLVSPNSVSLSAGSMAQVQGQISRLAGHSMPVTITASATGLQTLNATVVGTQSSAALPIEAVAAASAGTRLMTLTASDGVRVVNSPLEVEVLPEAAPDFSLSGSPSYVSIQQNGAVATLHVQVARLNGFTGPVALSIQGLPAGVDASTATIANTSTVAALTLRASAGAAVGNATITVTGNSGTTSKTTTVSLVVNEQAAVSTDVTSGTPAFPGAEGFGARASGGRGGAVCYVTNLSPRADVANSLQWCINQPGKRYVLFKVSGVIDGSIEINRGDITIAGQTSPGGITVRGIYLQGDQVCEADGCPLPSVYPRNFILRHLRSRKPTDADTLRLHRAQNGIIDHCSFGNADDEVAQISFAQDITIQNTIFAETLGDHAVYGGMLINYSDPARGFELTRLSFHHNNWNRLIGRMPEISRENPSAVGSTMDIELSNNLLWDPGAPVYTATGLGQAGSGEVYFRMNWIGNYAVARPVGAPSVEPGIAPFTYGMISNELVEQTGTPSRIFYSGNRINQFPQRTDYQLAYCCNDYPSVTTPPFASAPPSHALTQRHAFPPITYHSALELPSYMVSNVGAFPRDPMDTRLMAAVGLGVVSQARRDMNPANDALITVAQAGPAPTDTDGDGMPDAWESENGLNPSNASDRNSTNLSPQKTGQTGYTNLEVYLNELAASRVLGR